MTRQKRPDPIKALARDVSALVQVPSVTGDELGEHLLLVDADHAGCRPNLPADIDLLACAP